MEAKIFIGCVTYAKDEYALPVMADSLRRFTTGGWELHVIDTTEATAPALAPYCPRLLEGLKSRLPGRAILVDCYVPRRPGVPAFEVIANARNQLREAFLQSDCTHLLFIDDDMRFPPQTLSHLLSHDAPVAVGVYLNNLVYRTDQGPITRIGPVAYIADPKDEARCRPLRVIDVLPERTIPVVLTGFGCALLRREVLEQVPIVYDAQQAVTEDTPFYNELARRQILVLLDTRVKCAHLKFPLGDERNRYFDLGSYRVQAARRP